ncbi:MAG: tetratricopeptide repeat protein, partial [Acidimicrobiia bacterium]
MTERRSGHPVSPIPAAEPPMTDLRMGLERLRMDLELRGREIDALQVQLASGSRPWYLQASTVVAAVALLFSFGTTAVSFQRTTQEDLLAARAELTGHLQRLSALQIDNLRFFQEADPAAANRMSSALSSEANLIANQALTTITRLPPDWISALEFVTLGETLLGVGNYPEALRMFQAGVDVSQRYIESVVALKGLGNIHYQLGDPEAGRAAFQAALGAASSHPDMPSFYVRWSDARTEMAWASS